MARVQEVIRSVAPHDSVERYTALGVEVRQGHARLCDPWTVEIDTPDGGTERLTARSIVIAAGARPFVPPLPGLDEVGYVTSDTLWDEFARLDTAPKRLIVLGGGPIGTELAQAMARLGSEVTVITSYSIHYTKLYDPPRRHAGGHPPSAARLPREDAADSRPAP